LPQAGDGEGDGDEGGEQMKVRKRGRKRAMVRRKRGHLEVKVCPVHE
jgi:hypothetical protein